VQSIHGQMPYTFDNSTPEALISLKTALFGGELVYESSVIGATENRVGEAEGVLIGGNLTLLVMLQGSRSEIDYTDKILFVEDVGEHEYSVDRMMRMLKRSEKLSQLKGLIVGAFNEFDIEEIPFGASPEEVIWELVKEYNYPVCFNFPVGHINNNRAMIVGRTSTFKVNKNCITLAF
jgi:muramoyltetrapeptide carboxypeptidase